MPFQPLVSIIVPNYNHGRFLKERLDSIFAQSYANYEVILLDDCSSDSSRDVLKAYAAHPKVSKIDFGSVCSGSPFRQWHKGLQMARGEMVWIAESDDVAHSDFLAEMVQCMRQADVALAYCQSILIDKDGVEIGRQPVRHAGVMSGEEFARRCLAIDCDIWNASSAIFRRPRFDTSFLCEFRACGDKMLWFKMANAGSVACIGKPLNYFRQHGANTTQQRQDDGTRLSEEHAIYESMRLPAMARLHVLGSYLSRISNWHRGRPQIKRRLFKEWGLASPAKRAFIRVAYRIMQTFQLNI